MTPCIEAMRTHAIAKLQNEPQGDLIQIDLEDGPFADFKQFECSATCWGMFIENMKVGEIVIATERGKFVIGLDDADPFYEANPNKEYRLQSETERLILESDFQRSYQACYAGKNDDLEICKQLGVMIAPQFRGAGDYQTLVYDRNDLIPTGD